MRVFLNMSEEMEKKNIHAKKWSCLLLNTANRALLILFSGIDSKKYC